MYGQNDLRTTLVTAQKSAAQAPAPKSFKHASYARFYAEPPQEADDLAKTWYARGATLIVAYSEVEAGAVFERSGQPDEYAVVIPDDGVEIEIAIPEGSEIASGKSVSFMPAGDSRITVLKGGRILRLLTIESADLVAKCANAADYADPDPNVPPLAAWPDPSAAARCGSIRAMSRRSRAGSGVSIAAPR
jgi:hypothetical protein